MCAPNCLAKSAFRTLAPTPRPASHAICELDAKMAQATDALNRHQLTCGPWIVAGFERGESGIATARHRPI